MGGWGEGLNALVWRHLLVNAGQVIFLAVTT